MYFIYKDGVYGHGVFWIGSDLSEGRHRLIELAEGDSDDYHDWRLFEYVSDQDPKEDHKHTPIMSVRSTKGGRYSARRVDE